MAAGRATRIAEEGKKRRSQVLAAAHQCAGPCDTHYVARCTPLLVLPAWPFMAEEPPRKPIVETGHVGFMTACPDMESASNARRCPPSGLPECGENQTEKTKPLRIFSHQHQKFRPAGNMSSLAY